MRRLLVTLLATALMLPMPMMAAQAQAAGSDTANVVIACGTPNSTYSVGANRPFTQDTTGTLCSTGSGGSGSNAAAGPTGSAVPADASYNGLNVGGTLRGQTGVNPTGSVFAGQMDLASIAGTVPALGNGTAANVLRVTLASDSTGLVTTAAIGTIGATAPTKADTFGWIDGSGNLQGVSASNPLPISVASLPLPSGAATAANQTTANSSLATIATNSGAAIPAGTNLIGKVGLDQTTPGTTNNVTVSTNVGTLPLVQATASAAISIASGTTTQIIAASGSTVIRIMQLTFVADATNTVTYESGDTGGSCANPVALSGAEAYAANGGESDNGLTFVLPSGKAFCILTTAAGHGHVAYAQF